MALRIQKEVVAKGDSAISSLVFPLLSNIKGLIDYISPPLPLYTNNEYCPGGSLQRPSVETCTGVCDEDFFTPCDLSWERYL